MAELELKKKGKYDRLKNATYIVPAIVVPYLIEAVVLLWLCLR